MAQFTIPFLNKETAVVFVDATGNPSKARPSGAVSVRWKCETQPVNMTDADEWNGPATPGTALAVKYYDDAGTYVDRGAVQTISRNLPNPNGFQPTVWVNVSGKGDNSTFKGVVAVSGLARDRADVTTATKGVLYGGQFVAAPIVDRDNVPFDDVVGVSIENQGSARGTDALYFGHTRADRTSNPLGDDWGNIIQNDAAAPNFIRSIGQHDIGLSLSGATITTAAIRLGNMQTIAALSSSGVLTQLFRLSLGNTLRLYEGGVDIRSDLSVYLGARAVLKNALPLRSVLGGGVTTETDLVSLDSANVMQLYAGKVKVSANGDLTIANNKSLSFTNAASTNTIEAVRLTASDNLTFYAARATLLAGGGLVLANGTAVPSVSTAGPVLYSEAGSLKVKSPSGVITILAPA